MLCFHVPLARISEGSVLFLLKMKVVILLSPSEFNSDRKWEELSRPVSEVTVETFLSMGVPQSHKASAYFVSL